MRLCARDAAVLAGIVDDRSPEIDIAPRECALLIRLLAFLIQDDADLFAWQAGGRSYVEDDAAQTKLGSIELSPEEAALAAECVEAAIPDWARARLRLAVELRRGSARRHDVPALRVAELRSSYERLRQMPAVTIRLNVKAE